MKYFNNVSTLEDLRRQYKELLKKYHPDNPQSSTEACLVINAEYDRLQHISSQTIMTTNTIGKTIRHCVRYYRKSSTQGCYCKIL